MRAAGHAVALTNDRPIIGILNSVSELNPCNLPLRHLTDAVKTGVEASGAKPAMH
jgi:dihydroxyacid dehydratase/phosphogluconate dehydratase